MSMSLWHSVYNEQHNRILREEGPEAAERFHHSQVGGIIEFNAGMLGGAAVGTAILPGVGTVIGGLVGMTIGFFKGTEDETGADNLRRLGKAAVSASDHIRKL